MLTKFKLANQPHHEDEPGTVRKLVIAIGSVLLVSFILFGIFGWRGYRVSYAQNEITRADALICQSGLVDEFEPVAQELESQWETHVLGLNIKYNPIGRLNFSRARLQLLIDGCVQVNVLADAYKNATTDGEKIDVYEAAVLLQKTIRIQVANAYNEELKIAVKSIDQYKKIETDFSARAEDEYPYAPLIENAQYNIERSEWATAAEYLNAYQVQLDAAKAQTDAQDALEIINPP